MSNDELSKITTKRKIEEINKLEQKVTKSQNAFKNCISETCSAINASALQLNNVRKLIQDSRCEINNNIDNNTSSIIINVENLQNKFKECLVRKKLSINRSLIEISNLLSQYSLLNMPYDELKLYNGQIFQHIKNSIPDNNSLSYSEALHILQQINKDVNSVEYYTNRFIKDRRKELLDTEWDSEDFKELPQRMLS